MCVRAPMRVCGIYVWYRIAGNFGGQIFHEFASDDSFAKVGYMYLFLGLRE